MVLDEIVSIRKVGIRRTVDIEVDGDHLFFCNGILTHNSAAGETNDITEENIQGGISKIQAADNVIGFIPSSAQRQVGIMRAKFIKTRDSGGVGSFIDFKTDWSTLTFEPYNSEDGGGAFSSADHRQSNIPKYSGNNSSGGQKEYKKPDAIKKEIPTAIVKTDESEVDSAPTTINAIRKIGGRSKPHEKKLKLI